MHRIWQRDDKMEVKTWGKIEGEIDSELRSYIFRYKLPPDNDTYNRSKRVALYKGLTAHEIFC